MSAAKLKPIETTYRGHRFRSRLEARWAVFLDALGVEWWYEHEGYHLGDGPFGKRLLYLPDFYIPEQARVSKGPFFVEVKPEPPNEQESHKLERLARKSGLHVYCCIGPPRSSAKSGNVHGLAVWIPGYGDDDPFPSPGKSCKQVPIIGWDDGHRWCECSNCGILGIEFEGRVDRLSCECALESRWFRNAESPRLKQAYNAARTARFGR